jgi:hypothetical protein
MVRRPVNREAWSGDDGDLVEMNAASRAELAQLRGEERASDPGAARDKLRESREKEFPIHFAELGEAVGYPVLRMEDGVVWAE